MPQVRHRRHRRRCRAARRSLLRGFTLIELLVVIGVIGVLIALLLPTLVGVVARGRDVKCQSNLRSIVQAMHGYAAEHGGQFPWGHIKNRMRPGSWEAEIGTHNEVVCWAALVARQWNRDVPPVVGRSGETIADIRLRFPSALTCPEALQQRDHVVSYAVSMVVGACPYLDSLVASATHDAIGSLTRPVKQHLFGKDQAVVWDTAILIGEEFDPSFRIGADIDAQRIWSGALNPQYRFYSLRDPFAAIPPGWWGYHVPMRLAMASTVFQNREPATAAERFPFQGNLRFRHRKQTTCNAGFADGSVRQLTAKLNLDRTVRSHDAIRRYFMLKYPPGIGPSRKIPF